MKLVIRPLFKHRPKRLALYRDEKLAGVATKQPEGRTDTAINLKGNTITLKTVIYLPEWRYAAKAVQTETEEWDRFIKALLFHEQGHVEISMTYAKSLQRLLRKTPKMARVELFYAEQEKLMRLHDAYDFKTDHGRRQETPYGSTTIKF